MRSRAQLVDLETVPQAFTTIMTFHLLGMETPIRHSRAVDILVAFLTEIIVKFNICHIQTILVVAVAELVARGQTQVLPRSMRQLWVAVGMAFHMGARYLI
jgi:hypothetical protein